MARMRFLVEVESDLLPKGAPVIGGWIERRVGSDPINSSITRVSVTPCQSNPVDAHGEHGMADGSSYVPYADLHKHARVVNVGMADTGPAPIRESEERPATCSCYVGAGAQPYAHEPSCAVHPRFADTQLLEFNGTVQDVSIPRLDDAEQDGEAADVEAEYARALASSKAEPLDDGAVHRLLKLGKSLGYSLNRVHWDVFGE